MCDREIFDLSVLLAAQACICFLFYSLNSKRPSTWSNIWCWSYCVVKMLHIWTRSLKRGFERYSSWWRSGEHSWQSCFYLILFLAADAVEILSLHSVLRESMCKFSIMKFPSCWCEFALTIQLERVILLWSELCAGFIRKTMSNFVNLEWMLIYVQGTSPRDHHSPQECKMAKIKNSEPTKKNRRKEWCSGGEAHYEDARKDYAVRVGRLVRLHAQVLGAGFYIIY